MTMEERSVWAQLVVFPLAGGIYFTVVLTRAAQIPIAEVSWVVPMIWTAGLLVGGIILGIIAQAIGSGISATVRGEEPEYEDGDIRDKEIERHGDYKARFFTSMGGVAVIVLAMARADHFWIANAIFLAGILGETYASIVKIRLYRRGF